MRKCVSSVSMDAIEAMADRMTCPCCGQPFGISDEERAALRHTRRNQGILLKVLAAKLGVANNTLISWEDGSRRPSQERLRLWRAALHS